VDCVSLSLDGGSAKVHDYLRGIPGAFEKTLNAINRLIEEKLPVSVITTVSKTNLNELDKIKNPPNIAKIITRILKNNGYLLSSNKNTFLISFLLNPNSSPILIN
ncbi:unnamed protein product, partial [marine sediment metagenome]